MMKPPTAISSPSPSTPPSPAKPTSYQLPDLPSLIRPFDLRTNRHCRPTSRASARWLLQHRLTTDDDLHRLKPGLLAALCFPAVDACQLRLAADFCALMLHDGGRALGDEASPLWLDLQSRLTRTRPPPSAGFYAALASFRSATAHAARAGGAAPDLESFIELRREISGVRAGMALIASLGGMHSDLGASGKHEDLERLTRSAVDIVAWSWDIVAYSSLHARGPPALTHNLVHVLMTERALGVQGAVALAGKLVAQSVDAFCADERAFRAARKGDECAEEREYVGALRDWIAGAVNWAYESEVWVGTRGSEVREFGWVFLG